MRTGFETVSRQITKIKAVVLSLETGTSIIADVMSSIFWISSLFVAFMLIPLPTMIVCAGKLPKTGAIGANGFSQLYSLRNIPELKEHRNTDAISIVA